MEPKVPRRLGPWHQPVVSFDPGPPLSSTHDFGWVSRCSVSSSNKWGGEVPPHSSNGQKEGNSERGRTPSPEQRDRRVGEERGHARFFHGFSLSLHSAQHTAGGHCTSARCTDGGMTAWETRNRVQLCLLTA